MLVTLGRLPVTVAIALGGVAQGGGVFDVPLPVAAIVRACGGAESGGGETFRILLESGDTLTYESGDHMKQDQA